MAKIENAKTSKVVEVPDGEEIITSCFKMGVPFGCEDGHCGMCMIDIIEGEENLNELTDKEDQMGMTRDQRLCCQCKIKSGKVKIDF